VSETPESSVIGVRDEIEAQPSKLLLSVEHEARQTAAALFRERQPMVGGLDLQLSPSPAGAARRGRLLLLL